MYPSHWLKIPVGATQAIEMIKLAPYPFSLSVAPQYADGIVTTAGFGMPTFEQIWTFQRSTGEGAPLWDCSASFGSLAICEKITEMAEWGFNASSRKPLTLTFSYLHSHAGVRELWPRTPGWERRCTNDLYFLSLLIRLVSWPLHIMHLWQLNEYYGDNGNILMLITLRKSLEPMSLLISSLKDHGFDLMPTISFSVAGKTRADVCIRGSE